MLEMLCLEVCRRAFQSESKQDPLRLSNSIKMSLGHEETQRIIMIITIYTAA